jgi:predicted nucleic acid-binding protein
MPNKVFVDTAYMFALVNEQDTHQRSKGAIKYALTSTDIEIIHLTPALFERAFDLYRTHLDKEWGLIDCVSFIVMSDEGITQALTTDKHFTQAGFQILMQEAAR